MGVVGLYVWIALSESHGKNRNAYYFGCVPGETDECPS